VQEPLDLSLTIFKFCGILNAFDNLEVLQLHSLSAADHIFKKLAGAQQLSFAHSLKHLTINACVLEYANGSSDDIVWPADEKAFGHMNNFILRLENLESMELSGMSIVDHLGDLTQAINRPKLRSLSLPYNGLEAEYCLYFKHLLNFETLQHLNLSCNWFGMPGLARFKHTFKQFKCLKVLNLSNNKLCQEEEHDTRDFRDTLAAVGHSLEELLIMEN
jgi:hypothetical protein